jgi:hypothetical protein
MVLHWNLKRVLRQYRSIKAAAFEDGVDAAAIRINLAAQIQAMVNGTTAALVPHLQYALRHIGVLPDPVIVQAQVQGFLCFQTDRDIFARLQVGK